MRRSYRGEARLPLKSQKMDVLLTFTGFHDPYSIGLVGQEEQPGPILSLVKARSFDQVILFSTPIMEKNTLATREALQSSLPALDVQVRDLQLNDPTNYVAILKGLRAHVRDICDSTPKANYFIAVASGTPQMHACWMLLAASGEIPAHILNVRPPRFVSKDRPLVSEVDLTSTDFPVVRANVCNVEAPDVPPPDLDTVVRGLGIVGDHPSIRRALKAGVALAPSAVPILILGETGTGKELFARFVHRLSERPREWRQREGGEKLHNRYILTDIGGVSFAVGLDDGDDGETDEVTLLEEKTYKFRWMQYRGPEQAFYLVDELIIEGRRALQ
jgi:Regulator of RNA terminal phosphate cyclase/Sigma-54 interaction domain/CRISPR-associated protein (Cas_Csm6)